MADFLTQQQRSTRMATIKGKDTLPEMVVRKALHAAGLRFRLHRKDLPGRPDILLPRFKTIIMVNGCFWHGHHCQRKGRIEGLSKYWQDKITNNQDRDMRNKLALEKLGYRVITIWECQLGSETKRFRTLKSLVALLQDGGVPDKAVC